MVLNDWNSWNLQCAAVTAGGRGRCRVKWSEGQNTLAWGQSARQLTCPHVGRWDFDAGRLISAKDYFGGILIPSPVCRQHDLIWTSESKISRNLPQVKTILSSVFYFSSSFEFDLWITPVGTLVSTKLPKLTLFLMRKLRPLNAEILPIKGNFKRFLHIVLISPPKVHRELQHLSKLVQWTLHCRRFIYDTNEMITQHEPLNY